MRAHHVRTGLLAGFAVLASTQWSMALDADDFAKKLTDAYLQGGAELIYDNATTSGDTVTLSDAAFRVTGAPINISLGDLIFNGVSEDSSGGYTVASFKKDDISFSADRLTMSMKGLSIEGMRIPANTATPSLDDVLVYRRAETGPIAVTIDDRNIVKLARSSTSVDKSPDGGRLDVGMRAEGLEIDLSDVGDTQAQQAINGMGYQYLNGDIVMKGSWQPESGELSIAEYAYTLNDVGRLDMQFSFSGYTLDFIHKLQQLQEQTGDAQSQQAMGLALMGLMQELTFNSLSIRFDDASVTNKLLEMAASRQGMSRDQMVQGLQAMMPFALAQLNNPEFQKMVTEAVSLYLSDPRNLEIAVQPDSPLPFAAIAGSAMAAPQSLPDLLNVTVTANQ